MTKHTLGPWGCVDTSNHAHDYRLTKPNGDVLPLGGERYDNSEQRANARLIAAAPELLHALQMARSYIIASGAKHWEKDLAKVDAALAKAEGK
jgi:hypothetical protein